MEEKIERRSDEWMKGGVINRFIIIRVPTQ